MESIDLGTTPVRKIFWTYAIPSMLMMVSQKIATLVDSIFVGRHVGPEGLSSIALTMPILMLLGGISAMFCVGGTALAGIELGKGNKEKSNNFFNVTTAFLVVVSIIASLATIFFIDRFVHFFGVDGIARTYMIQYGRTMGFFFPFFLLNISFSFFIRLEGKPILTMIIMLSGIVINVILDYLLIAVFQMGLIGAALATGLSQMIPWTIATLFILTHSTWHFKLPIIRWKEIRRIVFNGISEFLSNTSISISGLVINFIVMDRIGIRGVAAYAVALQVAGLATFISYGFSDSNMSGISYNYGAQAYHRVSRFFRLTVICNLVTGLLLFVGSYFFGEGIASIFVKDAVVIQTAAYILKYYAVAFIFLGVNIFFGTYFTAIDDPLRSGIVTVYRSLIALVVGILVLPVLFGNAGIWLTIVAAEITTLVVGAIMYVVHASKLRTRNPLTAEL